MSGHTSRNKEVRGVASLVDLMNQYDNFDDLPYDEETYVPRRKVQLNQQALCPPVRFEDTSYEAYLRRKWDSQVSTGVPDAFDPDKLEAERRARLRACIPDASSSIGNDRDDEVEDDDNDDAEYEDVYVDSEDEDMEDREEKEKEGEDEDDHEHQQKEPHTHHHHHHHHHHEDGPSSPYASGSNNNSSESIISITSSLDSESELEGYESEVTVTEAVAKRLTPVRPRSNAITMADRPELRLLQPPPPTLPAPQSKQQQQQQRQLPPTTGGDPIKRVRTPRIKKGSKPPLSMSAYAGSGVPCLDPNCAGCDAGGGDAGDAGSTRRSKPPKYFPFQRRGRSRKGSSGSK
ncbi:hypothetical protein F4778DRAFT_57250 [Xylariomycetidae sp. FL2044]|nr:hypothetical protein F4778DRAFT_57250 [Xylariomycetidae sp. FL2044]